MGQNVAIVHYTNRKITLTCGLCLVHMWSTQCCSAGGCVEQLHGQFKVCRILIYAVVIESNADYLEGVQFL